MFLIVDDKMTNKEIHAHLHELIAPPAKAKEARVKVRNGEDIGVEVQNRTVVSAHDPPPHHHPSVAQKRKGRVEAQVIQRKDVIGQGQRRDGEETEAKSKLGVAAKIGGEKVVVRPLHPPVTLPPAPILRGDISNDTDFQLSFNQFLDLQKSK